jgi:hypothetical protein
MMELPKFDKSMVDSIKKQCEVFDEFARFFDNYIERHSLSEEMKSAVCRLVSSYCIEEVK